jgi:hypothetical protein
MPACSALFEKPRMRVSVEQAVASSMWPGSATGLTPTRVRFPSRSVGLKWRGEAPAPPGRCRPAASCANKPVYRSVRWRRQFPARIPRPSSAAASRSSVRRESTFLFLDTSGLKASVSGVDGLRPLPGPRSVRHRMARLAVALTGWASEWDPEPGIWPHGGVGLSGSPGNFA